MVTEFLVTSGDKQTVSIKILMYSKVAFFPEVIILDVVTIQFKTALVMMSQFNWYFPEVMGTKLNLFYKLNESRSSTFISNSASHQYDMNISRYAYIIKNN